MTRSDLFKRALARIAAVLAAAAAVKASVRAGTTMVLGARVDNPFPEETGTSDRELILDALRVPNGQCPVCVTQAPKWHRNTGSVIRFSGRDDQPVGRIDREPYGPAEKLVRCAVCNAAFWQDAEE
jgi:hypothetical protein